MSGHTYVYTYTHTHIYTYIQDNYSNPRCAYARRGLMNKGIGMLLQKRANTNGIGISNNEEIYIPPYNNTH